MDENVFKEIENLSDDEVIEEITTDESLRKIYLALKWTNNEVQKSFLNRLNNFSLSSSNQGNQQLYINFKNRFNLIKECNAYLNDIDTDIILLTKHLKSIYSKRFPELESIVLQPLDYAKAVCIIGNNLSIDKSELESFLPNHQIMAITIMASNTTGKPLDNVQEKSMKTVYEDIFKLNEIKEKLIDFVQSNLKSIAPNLSTLVGTSIAAQLIIAAGGLIELSKTPASNILVFGAKRQNLEGFSTANKLHRGYLAECDQVKTAPDNVKVKVLRMLASKSALLARVDAFRKPTLAINNKVSAEYFEDNEEVAEENNVKQEVKPIIDDQGNYFLIEEGRKLQSNIENRLEKIQTFKLPNTKKPLPRPDDAPKKRRGGKRIKNLKSRYEQTELRMQKNRMKFGTEAEKEYRDTGIGYGMLGVGGVGSKVRISKKKQKMANRTNNLPTQGQQTSGLSSSVAFTSTQGIDLINPDRLGNQTRASRENYFSNTSGFSTVIRERETKSGLSFNVNQPKSNNK